MNIRLEPAESDLMVGTRLEQALLDRVKDRVDRSMRDSVLSRALRTPTADVQVTNVGNAITVEVSDPGLVRAEKERPARQMIELEGSVVPIKTPQGTIFRKATRLSMILGKWTTKGAARRGEVKAAIDRSFSDSADALLEAKEDVRTNAPPRVRDVLGIGNGRRA